MPGLATIRRFNSIRNLGVFQKHPSSAGNPEFKELNLIYGFNGTGKTTLSRIFASLEAGLLRPEIPSDGTFEIELSDGVTISNVANLNALKGRVLVFNTDFVEANLRWKDGKANPIFYLGVEQARLSQQLESLEKSLAENVEKFKRASGASSEASKAFAAHKRNAAREIGEQVNEARSYNAGTIAADYASGEYGNGDILEEVDRRHLRQLINADVPPSKVDQIEVPDISLKLLRSKIEATLHTTLGELAIDELSRHETMLTWVKEGLTYHDDNGLQNCLLCGNLLSNERRQNLREALDARFDRLFAAIGVNKEALANFHSQLIAIKTSIPSKNDIAQDFWSDFESAAQHLKKMSQDGMSHVDAMFASLDEKVSHPNSVINDDALPSNDLIETFDAQFPAVLKGLNAVIERHNSASDDFDKSQAAAKEKLKRHFLAEGKSEYDELMRTADDAESELQNIQKRTEELQRQCDELRQSLREYGPAAEKINELLVGYLGHEMLRIEAIKEGEEGYEIVREGKPLTGPLSEGEKTAIAICYFLSTIKAEGRRLKELIIVVDDPISSLDTRALNYAFNLLRGAIAEAAQVVFLTHNLHFMNETKKWLKKRAEKGSAALLFLDGSVDPSTHRRVTEIRDLPKLIREYESEYHYLFFLALGFLNDFQNFEGYFYLMPNALRKILDIFFAFKVPGSSGLSGKLDSAVVKDSGIGSDRIRAIDRLVQLESHADNLEDLISLSSMTLEETRDATAALFSLVEAVDPNHYKQMRALCQ